MEHHDTRRTPVDLHHEGDHHEEEEQHSHDADIQNDEHPHPHVHAHESDTQNDEHPHAHDANVQNDEHPHPHAHSHEGDTQNAEHPHPHAHSHEGEAHDHGHSHGDGWWDRVREAIPFLHGHSHGEANVDTALEASTYGIWALKVSLLGLGLTALFQLVIVLLSGSVALLADTIHNFSDALTAVPLWIAFILSRRAANRRYTYGYGRAEDVAGVIIVLMIFASSLLAAYESYQKFIHPQPLHYAWWVIVAALVGFVGNEGVAVFRIRVGREIGSAALIADGQHARIDGITSLAVLFGAVGSLLGFPLADPIIGLLITIAILFIVRDIALVMWRRLMDAVDPTMVSALEEAASQVTHVEEVHDVRLRWLGHKLYAELHIVVNEDLSTRESHQIAEGVRHALFHAQPRLSVVNVHVDPCGHSGVDHHELTAHHA